MGKSIVFVDTENVSFDRVFNRINTYVKYDLDPKEYIGTWCFGLEDGKSNNSNVWKDEITDLKSYFWESIEGVRSKDLVDNEIVKHINSLIDNPQFEKIEHYVLVTADGGFCSIAEKLRSKGKYVTVIASGEISKKLRDVCNRCIIT